MMKRSGNLLIVQELSDIVEKQNTIIKAQAEALAQVGAACMEDEITEVNEIVEFYLGSKRDT